MNENLNGIVVVNKEQGYTSHDVVNILRKKYKIKKVGHTGTLDPNATGVLPVCFGSATKVADMITLSDKEYIAEMVLGKTTDTQDIWGKVVSQKDARVSQKDFEDAIMSFCGTVTQIPPMFSAIKVNGKKLYEYARAGIEIERKKRVVEIKEIEILNLTESTAKFRVKSEKGLYVRTLCNDIGEKLGCGACMTSLLRTQSSCFKISDANTLSQLDSKSLSDVLISTDKIFLNYPSYTADEEIKTRLINGAVSTVNLDKGQYRVYDETGLFLCVADVFYYNGRNVIKSKKLFI